MQNNKLLKISIIIPTKNEEKYLPKLLESIKKQTIQPYEIIVADASSTDRTVEIAKKYGAKVVKGGLPAVGRNNGAKAAKGDILVFLDADAILPHTKTLEQWQAFILKKQKEFKQGFLAPILFIFKDYGEIKVPVLIKILKIFGAIIANLFNTLKSLIGSTFSGAGDIIVTKEAFLQLGGYDTRRLLGEDVVFANKAKKMGLFAGWVKDYVYVSDRRLNNLRVLLMAPVLMIVGLIVELFVLVTRNERIFYWWQDRIVAPLYGPLGGDVNKHLKDKNIKK